MRYVEEYIELYKSGQLVLNEERIKLLDLIENDVLTQDVYFDEERIEKCIRFIEKWYFELKPFQKFIIAFIFLRRSNGLLFYDNFLLLMGRGAGKNGLISGVANFLISELNGIPGYNVSVVANSEEQAMTSVTEVHDAIEMNPKLQKAFKNNKTEIISYATKSKFAYRTSNGNTKDGLRDGAVIFDEVHQYADNANVKVHESGLGKVKDAREFKIGSDGYVRDGYLDKQKEIANHVLNREAPADMMFPFICKLDKREDVNDSKNWEKANPMFSKPLSEYGQRLFAKVKSEYETLVYEPSKTDEFMTKRMNMPALALERSVAPYDEIKATNRKYPVKLDGRECIAAVDFASIRDFTACGLLFRNGEDYLFKHHSFARKEFVQKMYSYGRKQDEFSKKVVAPIADWEKRGLVDVINTNTIEPSTVVMWFIQQRQKYNIKKVIMDNFRAELLRKYFEDAGFEVEVIKNPRAISALLAPRIEDGFANNRFIWEDDPMMRWYTNNVEVKIDKTGNKSYEKKEQHRRKTDGFMAFLYSLYRADEISDADMDEELILLDGLDF
ncbi:terminase large subunit [Ligilactobacillus sp. MP3]|uniref:terminase TerL endonuclease subunit n=1 Tax=Ligilactobacillus TaxID=2767887 RepID=UPI00210BF4A3|nr:MULTISPECIES: terminase TerL endonuclease subunit [Ligilactobacillus]MCQ4117081.1 terminase large subunit [Ligilactobacillus sp. MP3]